MKKLFLFGFYFVLSITMVCQQNITIQRTYSKAEYTNAYTRVTPPEHFLYKESLGLEATTNFNVDFEGSWTLQQREAFNYAVKIYSHLLNSVSPIKIKVEFAPLPAGSLAKAEVAYFYNNFSTGLSNTQYPIALAKAIDPNLDYSGYDFSIKFSINEVFYYGTDGIPQENHFDFVTLAMHEIGHGLGIGGTMNVSVGNGSWGITDYPNNIEGNYPDIYDRFGVYGTTKLLDVTNPSTLSSYLTSGNVFFNGENARKANNNNNPKLFAPWVWDEGSSFAHLDKEVFKQGNINSLYTEKQAWAEVIHTPGPVGLGILKDLGWPLNRYVIFINPSYENTIITKGQNYTIKWYDNTQTTQESVRIELQKMINGEPIYLMQICTKSSINGSNNQHVWQVPQFLESEYYCFQVEDPYTGDFLGTSGVFYLSDAPAQPVFAPAGSMFSSPQYVRLSSPTQGVVIRYTIDNYEPDQTSLVYNDNNPIYIDKTTTIKSKSFLTLPNGSTKVSNLSEKTYFIASEELYSELWGNNNHVIYDGFGYGGGTPKTNWLRLGKTGNSTIDRSYIIWENIAQIIPRYAIITAVELRQTFMPSNTNGNIEFHHIDDFDQCDAYCKYNKFLNSSPFSTLPGNQNVFSLQGLVSKIQQIVNNNSGKLYLGLKNSNEATTSNFMYSSNTQTIMRIYFSPNVIVSQLDKNDVQCEKIAAWESNNSWLDRDAPFPLYINPNPPNNKVTLKSFQGKTTSNEKYWKWLDQPDVQNFRTFTVEQGKNKFNAKLIETYDGVVIQNKSIEARTLSIGNIQFKDPWLIDYVDPIYGLRNRGMKDDGPDKLEFKSRPSPFYPDYTTNYSGDIYKGVFLNQTPDPNNPNKPYYSVQAISPQDISLSQTGKTHRFYFQNWEYDQNTIELDNPNSLQTGIVFKDAPAILNANMKGTQLTNQSSAFSNNSQRKLIRSKSNDLHMVYSSLDKVWYEYSTNNGQTWELSYNSPGFSNTLTKSGSIDYKPKFGTQTIVNNIGIVVQEKTGNLSSIKFYGVGEDFFYFPDENPVVIEDTYFPYESYDLTPSFAWSHNGDILVIWKSEMDLRFWLGYIGPHGVECYETGNIQGVEGEPFNPTLYAGPQNTFHVAWQENSTRIVYRQFVCSGFSLTPITPREVVSYGSGFTWNYQPTITENNNEPRIGWVGKRLKVYEDEIDRLDKGTFTEEGVYEYRAILRRKINETGVISIITKTIFRKLV